MIHGVLNCFDYFHISVGEIHRLSFIYLQHSENMLHTREISLLMCHWKLLKIMYILPLYYPSINMSSWWFQSPLKI